MLLTYTTHYYSKVLTTHGVFPLRPPQQRLPACRISSQSMPHKLDSTKKCPAEHEQRPTLSIASRSIWNKFDRTATQFRTQTRKRTGASRCARPSECAKAEKVRSAPAQAPAKV